LNRILHKLNNFKTKFDTLEEKMQSF